MTGREFSTSREPGAKSTEARGASGLDALFCPRAVAVVGASRNPAGLGHRVLLNLLRGGFQGAVFPVNSRADVVASLPAFPRVTDVPRPVDLAILAVPYQDVLAAARDCRDHGVKALVVLSAGFAESGPEGAARQRELCDLVRGAGMRMVGPNCMGVLNMDPAVRLHATFGDVVPPCGRVAMGSQSGALGLTILEFARTADLGLSGFVSLGNKADLSGNDLLEYWGRDAGTDLILLYLESFGNPGRFRELATELSRRKPILAVKSGRSGSGRRAASSHTAALMSSDEAVGALFRQTGVLRMQTLEEMFDAAALLAYQPLPRGRRVAIVTNAGGPGILCADACEAAGLAVPPLSAATQELLRGRVSPQASLRNPVDLLAEGTPDAFHQAVLCVLDDDAFDAVIVIFTPLDRSQVEVVSRAVHAARRAAAPGGKPVLGCFPQSRGLAGSEWEGARIPTYRFPESAARALARAAERAEWLARPAGTALPPDPAAAAAVRRVLQRVAAERGGGWLLPDEGEEVLRHAGIATLPQRFRRSAKEAAAAARDLGGPVVLKMASATLVHKSEWRGVRVGLHGEGELLAAAAEIEEELRARGKSSELAGWVVQPVAPEGVELLIGMARDVQFGPLLAFGVGGTQVEIWKDLQYRLPPLTDQDAREMLSSIRGAALLTGYRGAPPVDRESLVDMLLRTSRLVESAPEIAELDFNPVRASAGGAQVLDARIRVE